MAASCATPCNSVETEAEGDTIVRLLSHEDTLSGWPSIDAMPHSTTGHEQQQQQNIVVYLTRRDALPPYQPYSQSAGWDLAACEEVLLAPGERCVCPTGLFFDMKVGMIGFIFLISF